TAAAVRVNIQVLLEAADRLERREREAEHARAVTPEEAAGEAGHREDTDGQHRLHRLLGASNSDGEERNVDAESTDCLTGDLAWSRSSASDSDERGSMQRLGSEEGYSSSSIKRRKLQDGHKTRLGL
ncbi:hypothetical protein EI555_002549, partial [Monodon monoceros]